MASANKVQTRSKPTETPPQTDAAEEQYVKFIKYVDKKMDEIKQELFKKIEQETLNIKKNLENEMIDMKKSVDFISRQYDDISTKVDTLLQITKKVEILEEANNRKESRINSLETRLAEIEQVSMSYNWAEFAGVVTLPNEEPVDTINRVLKEIQVKVEPQKIKRIIRYQDRSQKIEGGIYKYKIKLQDEETQQTILNSRKYAREKNIFVGELLTPYFKELLWKTKQKAKDNKYLYTWFKNNKILTKKNSDYTSKIISVKHVSDLQLII